MGELLSHDCQCQHEPERHEENEASGLNMARVRKAVVVCQKPGDDKDPHSEAQPGGPGLSAKNTAHLKKELERPMVDDMGETESATHSKGLSPP